MTKPMSTPSSPPRSRTSSPPASKRKAPKKWDKDGVNDGPSSMDILLDWITTIPNYARWRGNGSGETKEALCGEIVGKMKAAGILHRKNGDIRAKINEFQASYNAARDWSENTGEGIRKSGEHGSEATIKDALRKRCKYWDQLNPIFSERAASRPAYTADTLGEDDSNNDTDDEYVDEDVELVDDKPLDVTKEKEGKKKKKREGLEGTPFKIENGQPPKKTKLSVADAITASKAAAVDAQKSMMTEILNSNERIRREELSANLAVEKSKVKLNTMKFYHELGYSKEEIIDLVKDL